LAVIYQGPQIDCEVAPVKFGCGSSPISCFKKEISKQVEVRYEVAFAIRPEKQEELGLSLPLEGPEEVLVDYVCAQRQVLPSSSLPRSATRIELLVWF